MGEQAIKKPSILRRIVRWSTYAVIGFFVGSIGLTVLYKWIDPPVTPLMVGRLVEYKLSGEEFGIDYQFVPLNSISANLQRAVISSEDRTFFVHHGFNWDAIETNWDKLQDG